MKLPSLRFHWVGTLALPDSLGVLSTNLPIGPEPWTHFRLQPGN
ncbi:MAG: hypothetical protein V9H26_23370 [Verrucomicrobiota bacterium]